MSADGPAHSQIRGGCPKRRNPCAPSSRSGFDDKVILEREPIGRPCERRAGRRAYVTRCGRPRTTTRAIRVVEGWLTWSCNPYAHRRERTEASFRHGVPPYRLKDKKCGRAKVERRREARNDTPRQIDLLPGCTGRRLHRSRGSRAVQPRPDSFAPNDARRHPGGRLRPARGHGVRPRSGGGRAEPSFGWAPV